MRIWDFSRSAFGICAAATLAACGGSQPPIGAPGAMALPSAHMQKSPAQSAGRGNGAVEFVYVANNLSNNVSAFAINANNGALSQVQGSPFWTGYGPIAVAISPTGKYAYVADNGTPSEKPGDVSVFAINPHSGALTPVQRSPFTAGAGPLEVTISPNGKFAYVVTYGSSKVYVFAINASTGAMKQMRRYRTRPHPTAEAIDPTGRFIYVTHLGFEPYYHGGHIVGYAIDARSGALRELKHGVLGTGYVPDSAAIDPSGKFVYVANYAGRGVSAYAITARTGKLSYVQGSPFPGGFDQGAMVIDPKGMFAYMAFDLNVAGYTIAPNGALTEVQGSPFAGGYEPDGAAIDPLGKFVYVATTLANGDVYAYAIDQSTGALTQVPGSPFAAGTRPAGIATCEVERDRCAPAIL
jgi:6-phosphogluconolactonase